MQREVRIKRDSVLMQDCDNPEFIWFCQRGFRPVATFGQGDLGNDCIAINLGAETLAYAAKKGEVEGTVFWLTLTVLHELAHWATPSQRAHKHWTRFLGHLLITAEEKKAIESG